MNSRLLFLTLGGFFPLLAFGIDISPYQVGQTVTPQEAEQLKQRYLERKVQPWLKPRSADDISGADREQILYGIELLDKTVAAMGPKAKDVNKRYSGNGLNCSSCHLKGDTGLPGTRKDALPFTNIVNDYPNFRARSMSIGSAEDRVNGCMSRSMGDGKPLPDGSVEMKAILAYFDWLAEGSNKDEAMEGTGMPNVKLPERKAHVEAGKGLYATYCVACHGQEGMGLKESDYENTNAYQFPPLAGADSFNNGAGMSRLIKATRFIHSNMPLGASASHPVVTVDQAYDVAAYVLSLPRSERAGRDKDFPVKAFRPKDYPVPAYFDGDQQALQKAKYGPFD